MITYTTIAGDTFDKIALLTLGSEYLFPLIIKGNQQYRNVLIFSSGTQLAIPEVELASEGIPEWMSDELMGEITEEEETPEYASEEDS